MVPARTDNREGNRWAHGAICCSKKDDALEELEAGGAEVVGGAPAEPGNGYVQAPEGSTASQSLPPTSLQPARAIRQGTCRRTSPTG